MAMPAARTQTTLRTGARIGRANGMAANPAAARYSTMATACARAIMSVRNLLRIRQIRTWASRFSPAKNADGEGARAPSPSPSSCDPAVLVHGEGIDHGMRAVRRAGVPILIDG